MSKHSLVIVGSGPAGVSAAFPLVHAGCDVLMLDAGTEGTLNPASTGNLFDFRQQTASMQAEFFYGKDRQALLAAKGQSPKLRVPHYHYVYRDFHEKYGISTENFHVTGSLAKGGLSNAWGAVCYTYSQQEMQLPLEAYQALLQSYQRIAARMGISGPAADDLSAYFDHTVKTERPLTLHPTCQHLLANYRTQTFSAFKLGQPRSAVLSEKKGDRNECRLNNRCLWGCDAHSIYNAQFDVVQLQKHTHFKYANRLFLQKISQSAQGYELSCQHLITGERQTLTAETLILAAGTIGSTALVLDFMSAFHQPIRLQSNPCFALAFVMPKFLGSSITPKSFAMGQLGFSAHLAQHALTAMGTFYSPEALLANELIGFMPFSKKGAMEFSKYLMPAMLLANVFFPGEISAHRMELVQTQARAQLKIYGGVPSHFERAKKALLALLINALRRCGAWYIPFSCKVPLWGSDIHYAATLPMSTQTQPLTVDHDGQLVGAENFYVVDGSILPTLSAKNLTFTIMANADRIGRAIALRKKMRDEASGQA
ncbi:MAG: hypothetical protein A3F10_04935 [Coxiella sp. RIFCSPHIGHO2_12_FULL_42_15]|nr:MAG: hypothetical protein A3F10_04935 [Coxiella sp. RIFCSPHIGHO2_12_FULL_42_15]